MVTAISMRRYQENCKRGLGLPRVPTPASPGQTRRAYIEQTPRGGDWAPALTANKVRWRSPRATNRTTDRLAQVLLDPHPCGWWHLIRAAGYQTTERNRWRREPHSRWVAPPERTCSPNITYGTSWNSHSGAERRVVGAIGELGMI